MNTFFVIFFCTSLLLTSFFVITSVVPVFGIFFLILVFLAFCNFLFFLQLDFLGIIFLIIYVGAIGILFLFVVMMLDIKIKSKKNDFFKYFSLGSFISTIFFCEILRIFFFEFYIFLFFPILQSSDFLIWFFFIDKLSNAEILGALLFSSFYPFFLICGYVLLIALIGVISLTKTIKIKSPAKTQILFKQLSRDSKSAIFKIR